MNRPMTPSDLVTVGTLAAAALLLLPFAARAAEPPRSATGTEAAAQPAAVSQAATPAEAAEQAAASALSDAVPEDVIPAESEWRRRREASFKNSPLSPFSVAAAYYIEAGKTERIGADGPRIELGPPKPMLAMGAITYREERFWLGPVTLMEKPRLHEADEEGDPLPGGRTVEGLEEIDAKSIGGLGRFYFDVSPQSGTGRVMFYDPEAPGRKEFAGFKWFDPDPAFKVAAAWVPNPKPDEVTVATNRGLTKSFFRAGWLEFTVDGAERSLVMLSEKPVPEKGDHFFVPFRDATSGKETYEIGRYLQGIDFQGADAEHVLNFNRATNPFCIYSEHYNCPLPPEENNLKAAIRAGEKTYPHH